jgi:pyocin large subunit-like protein
MMRSKRALVSTLLAIILGVALFVMRGSGPAGPEPGRQPSTAQSPERTAPSAQHNAGIGFRSADRLAEHYAKHGREFGAISQAEYLRRAQALRDAPLSDSVLEIRRADGVVSRFDRATGSFIAFDPDGTIRTFFRPNDGENYFRRQASQAH